MSPPPVATLARRLSLFDATMIVMGGIVGAGIFMNPTVVAQEVGSTTAALGAWAVGGLFALVGAFIYAELAARRPEVGGQYAYLRDAFNPLAAFLYAWTLLLVSQSGGMAAVAMTFARYFRALTGVVASDGVIAVSALALLTIVNCFGVRAGSNVQSLFMVLKIGAIAMLIGFGFFGTPGDDPSPRRQRTRHLPWRPSARRSCRCSSPTAAGRPPVSWLVNCVIHAAICHSVC